MRTPLKFTLLTGAAILPAFGAGLDRSGQDLSAFFQEGTYAEVAYTHIDPKITGVDEAGRKIDDIAQPISYIRYGIKTPLSERLSVGILFDEPFAAQTSYSGNNAFSAGGFADTARGLDVPEAAIDTLRATPEAAYIGVIEHLKQKNALSPQEMLALAQAKSALAAKRIAQEADAHQGEGTLVDVRIQNITALFGVHLGDAKSWTLYAGPAVQNLKGNLTLRGDAYGAMNGYQARIDTDQAGGYVAGIAYARPDIALKVALSYRSSITHKSQMHEQIPALASQSARDFEVSLPKSYNLDLQSGLSPKMLGFAKVRYVPWSRFEIRPSAFDEALKSQGLDTPLVSYAKDQWQGEIGLARAITPRFGISSSIGMDSGAGKNVTTLGPVKGYTSLGLGAKYALSEQLSLQGGAKYLKFGKANAVTATGKKVGTFEDNDGLVLGLKLAYQAK